MKKAGMSLLVVAAIATASAAYVLLDKKSDIETRQDSKAQAADIDARTGPAKAAQPTPSQTSVQGQVPAPVQPPVQAGDKMEAKVIPQPAPFKKMTPQSLPPEAVQRVPVYRSVDELIRVTLDEALGRPANYARSIDKSAQDWSYICGQPREANNAPFIYQKSRLKPKAQSGQFEDLFCILSQKTEAGYLLREFEIGMTDNPMTDWAQKHPAAAPMIKRAEAE